MAQKFTEKAKTAGSVQPHSCGKCDKRWSGYNTSHCSSCHETFTGLSAFDRHRTGSHAAGTRKCLPPADVGLAQVNRSYPCWGTEGDDRWNDQTRDGSDR